MLPSSLLPCQVSASINGPLEAYQIIKLIAVACPHGWNENNAHRSGKREEAIILLYSGYEIHISNGDAPQSKILIGSDDL